VARRNLPLYQRQADVVLANGANHNVAVSIVQNFVRVTGPTAPFSITGLTSTGIGGHIVVVHNATTFDCTVAHLSSSSIAANRIDTLTETDVTLAAESVAVLVYDEASAQWKLGPVRDSSVSAPGSYSNEEAQDAVGTILADTATINLTYTDATPEIKADVIDASITYAKIQNVSATDKLLGRSTAGAGVVEEIALTAAGRALLDDAAASDQRTTLGLGSLATVTPTGTPDGTKFLRDDSTWQTVSSGGLTHPQVLARTMGS